MPQPLHCYRCGASLTALTLPLSRRDTCPACGVDLRVCLMCKFYAPRLPDGCAEEAADDVFEKARANFCEYFVPSETAYAPGRTTAHARAEAELEALFGDRAAAPDADGDDALRDAESLFKS